MALSKRQYFEEMAESINGSNMAISNNEKLICQQHQKRRKRRGFNGCGQHRKWQWLSKKWPT